MNQSFQPNDNLRKTFLSTSQSPPNPTMKSKNAQTIQRFSTGRLPWIQATALCFITVLADDPVSAAPPPGQLLASMCFQCHGTNGQATAGFESISGKSANSMLEELLEMRDRRPEGIMDLQARAYTPEQLRLIANYLARLPKGSGDDDEEEDDH